MAQVSFNVRRVADRVVLTHAGRGLAMHHTKAEELYMIVKRLSAASEAYDGTGDHSKVRTDSETLDSKLTVHRTGLLFTFELERTIWIECPYTVARQLVKIAYQKAKEIEEEVKYLQTAEGQAILFQAGAPFSLTGNDKIIQEAAKLLPGAGSIPSVAVVGTPELLQHPPGGLT